MIGAALVLFWLQKDLGPALLFSAVLLAMLYVASGRVSYVALGLTLLVLGFALADRMFSHVHTRVVIWLDPWTNRETIGYQLVQALYALGSGGVFGTGLDMGSPRFIPAVHTDFVIAAIGEELGLAGTLAVVCLFVLLVQRGFTVALRCAHGVQCAARQRADGRARAAGADHPGGHARSHPANGHHPAIRQLRWKLRGRELRHCWPAAAHLARERGSRDQPWVLH